MPRTLLEDLPLVFAVSPSSTMPFMMHSNYIQPRHTSLHTFPSEGKLPPGPAAAPLPVSPAASWRGRPSRDTDKHSAKERGPGRAADVNNQYLFCLLQKPKRLSCDSRPSRCAPVTSALRFPHQASPGFFPPLLTSPHHFHSNQELCS